MKTNKGIFKGDWTSGRNKIVVNVSLISFEEDGAQVLYCPALDVSGYGATESEALNSFQVCLGEFLLYTNNKKTFLNELTRMGWSVRKSKTKSMIPPSMAHLLDTNDNFSRIFNSHPFHKFDRVIEMPAMA